MNKNTVAWWDDAIVGDTRVSFGRTITEADLIALCGLSGSYVPLHCDAEYAKTTVFGQRVVNAQMSMVIAAGLRASMIWYNGDAFCGESMIAFLGFDKVRFPAPLFINDTIHLEITILSKRLTSKPGRGVITFEDHVVKQDGTIVAQWERSMMFKTKPTDGIG